MANTFPSRFARNLALVAAAGLPLDFAAPAGLREAQKRYLRSKPYKS